MPVALIRALLVLPFGSPLAGCSITADAATPDPTAAVVVISTAPGEELRFVPAFASVTAAGPVWVTLRNESSQAHNLAFTSGVSTATRAIVEPGGEDQVVMAAGPGTYTFVCTIHEGMAGSLEIRVPDPSIRSGRLHGASPQVRGRLLPVAVLGNLRASAK